MDRKKWVRIYTTTKAYKAEMVKGILREHDLPCIDLNKRDSIYGTFGEIEVYALREDAVQALHILEKQQL